MAPRTTKLAAFELGAGMAVDVVDPAEAAARLREALAGERTSEPRGGHRELDDALDYEHVLASRSPSFLSSSVVGTLAGCGSGDKASPTGHHALAVGRGIGCDTLTPDQGSPQAGTQSPEPALGHRHRCGRRQRWQQWRK